VSGKNNSNWKGGVNKTVARRVRLRKSLGFHSLVEWGELKRQFNYMCLCCKKFEPEIKLEEDHIVPLALGGSNDISNIQPLCRSCNARKSTKNINYISQYFEVKTYA
jgi:5-methylcytosine-specific restriction endonuclease McrA